MVTLPEQYFCLFAFCQLEQSQELYYLYNWHNGTRVPLPQRAAQLLLELLAKPISSVKAAWNQQANQGIDTWIAHWVSSGWGFMTSRPELFPAMEQVLVYPSLNPVGQVSVSHKSALPELSDDWITVYLILEDWAAQEELEQCLNHWLDSPIRSILLTVPFMPQIDMALLQRWLRQHSRISLISVQGAPDNAWHDFDDPVLAQRLCFKRSDELLTENK
jgi:hypothetical protein